MTNCNLVICSLDIPWSNLVIYPFKKTAVTKIFGLVVTNLSFSTSGYRALYLIFIAFGYHVYIQMVLSLLQQIRPPQMSDVKGYVADI